MHFWIDKRSSYGLGQHSRPSGMGSGFGYQPRRNRKTNSQQTSSSSSSSATSSAQRQQTVAPSTSSLNSQGKMTNNRQLPHHHHHHHHRHRGRNQQHSGDDVALQNILIEDEESTTQNANSLMSNSQIPAVLPVYLDNVIATHQTIESTCIQTTAVNHWLPIQIICGLCMILAITLVLLKLYFESYMTGFQVVSLILISIVFLILTTLISLLQSRRKRLSQLQTTLNSHNGQTAALVQTTELLDSPPPYALALSLPEKQSEIEISSPPPSYEKINII
jgi:hypothetical protein